MRQAAKEEGVVLSDETLPDAPELSFEEMRIYNAFTVLCRQRQTSQDGMERLMISDVIAYHNKFDIDEADIFIELVCDLDEQFMKIISKRQNELRRQQARNRMNNGGVR